VAYVEKHDTIEDATLDDGTVMRTPLKAAHLPVFDCAFKPFRGTRSIHYKAHLKMMAAAQPFISGAISKTVNLPNEASIGDIRDAYLEAWRMGLKCVAIYRDGSKRCQPLNTKKTNEGVAREVVVEPSVDEFTARVKELEADLAHLKNESVKPIRRRLPETRQAVTHKFSIADHEGYLTVGLYDNGQPGELFVTMAKEGSTIGGLMDTIGALTSMTLQYGVPLETLVRKFAHQRFEPSGFTRNPDIRQASSIIDYVFRWMAIQFVPGFREATAPSSVNQPELEMPGLDDELKKKLNRPVTDLQRSPDTAVLDVKPIAAASVIKGSAAVRHGAALFTRTFQNQGDAPSCPNCGHIAVRNGACYKCLNCGESLGCS